MTVTTLLLLRDLTPTQKSYVTSKLNTKEKETSMAYICWILCGIHYFYLGQPIKNVICRIGSLETGAGAKRTLPVVICRIGSLEIQG